MPNDDLDAGGGAEDLELEPEMTPEEDKSKELGGDPLDELQDIEVVRAEAKKYRSIAQRLEKKPPAEAKPVVKPEDTSQFLTKADFFKSNERKAIREITADAEIKANWNEIIPFYTPRRGKETPEDIKEDILDAIRMHNEYSSGKERSTEFQYALAAGETITGLIFATTYVYPDQKLASVKPKSVVKRMKEKMFAASVKRENILECEKIGIPIDEFAALAIASMIPVAADLGL